MSIVFGILIAILKIIGLIFLTIITLLLLVVFVIAFVPIFYKVQAEKEEETDAEVIINWLFAKFLFKTKFDDQKPEIKFKIFGKDLLNDTKNKPRRKKKKRKKQATDIKVKQVVSKRDERAEPNSVFLIEEIKELPIVKDTEEMKKIDSGQSVNEEEKPPCSPMYRRVKMNKFRIDINEEKNIHEEEFESKSAEDIKKADNIKLDKEYFFKMPFEEKKYMLKIIFRFIKKIFKGVSPDKVVIDGVIGTGDPYTTGYVLASTSIAKGLINKDINVRGKFDEAYLKGRIKLEGKIFIITFFLALIQLLLEKPIRKMIKLYLKGRGE